MTLASKIFLASVPILINLYATRYREQDRDKAFPDNPPDFNLPIPEMFDFIIAGGGTAGCVLARRLSDQNFSVLLLEAGGNPPPLQAVPILSVYTHLLEDINFLYHSTRQEKAALAFNGILRTPGAKMLGGGTSHHDLMYERGHPMGYDEWAELTGDKSWRYKNLLKFFRKSENYMGKFPLSSGQHGTGGPMTVTRPSYAPGRSIFLKAGKERGYEIRDSNGPQGVGFSPNEFHHKFGRRVSTYTAFIEPIEKTQTKLTIRRYALVSQVIIEKKTARGLQYTHHGIPRVAMARKEIILCTGAYISPILLIKSGIGPLDQLKVAGISTPVSVLPVGHNLLDHPFLEISPIYVKDHSKAWQMEQNLTFFDFSKFIKHGKGPLTTSYTVPQAEALIASSRAITSEKKPEWPDLQIYYEYLGVDKNSVTCYLSINRPYSIGRLTLNSSAKGMDDPNLPILDYQYYAVDSDLDVMIEGINFCLDTLEKTKAFQKVAPHFTQKSIPQCKDKVFRSKEYWNCFTKQLTDSTYHASGTCRMGNKKDARSVVDSKFRVIGVSRLRVVDASIMPKIPNSNLAAPTIMIAEKAASVIGRHHKKKAKKAESLKVKTRSQ